MKPTSLEKLPFTTVLGYGAGDFGFNLAFSLSATFLLYYYTDVAGISAAAVGTMFFVVRLWDGLADLIAGRAVDRTMTRWGKFRPYLMFGAVPLLLLSYLVFHVPAGLEAGTKLLYAYISYAALGFVYSLANIPYGSLASAVTQSVHERAKLVAGRAFGAAVGSIILTFVIGGMVNDLRAQKAAVVTPADLAAYQAAIQDVFTKVTLAFIVIGTAAFWFTAWACRERVVRRQPRITVRETIATLKSNKPLAYLCGSSFFYMTGVFAVTGSTAFYAQYVLNDISLVGVITLVNTGISLLITPAIPWIIRKVGKKRVFQYCGVFTVVGGVGLFLAPAAMLWLVLLTLAIKGVGATLINTLMFGLEADTVEYGEWQTGNRSEGLTYALFTFTRKLCQSIGGALGAWALAFGGYVAASKAVPRPVQPESAILAIKATMGLLPAAAAVIAMLIFLKYPLTDSRFRQIRDETEARKTAALTAQPEPTAP
ncbi:glycoside-pentoside-hexuronide (GPH):cation symporter [Nonomuraea sp. NEAU-A123]|uniref:glycoside-pentoside-hexuronide (GPH):cation symporter n=1 Tax=Nonomuraea sp. NEAU-A123 TaxID=2839649 RepID=UPI001BE43670|nr:glycoside-pentoside-hexuronide (GPH):cation symporter [Nonomuraea sp. NEAU-A123]MBT2227172.1 glycoside-pentoside-hexuronide (GPH):cation symporter [Nonomuraea sp. NEAU-A123]